jgi:hypothetical protein
MGGKRGRGRLRGWERLSEQGRVRAVSLSAREEEIDAVYDW